MELVAEGRGAGPAEWRVRIAGRSATWAEVARALQEDDALGRQITGAIAAAPHEAVFWECAPSSAATRDRAFAFVLVRSAGLARARADDGPFREHLATTDPVVSFRNLGGDAVLVAPTAADSGAIDPAQTTRYAHLAEFARTAAPDQSAALWRAVGREVESWWAARSAPVWVSTSGLGVYWLHVRLDSRPKYYTHHPYRQAP